MGMFIEIALIVPNIPLFDPCAVVIFLLAMSSVIIGGYWGGIAKTPRQVIGFVLNFNYLNLCYQNEFNFYLQAFY